MKLPLNYIKAGPWWSDVLSLVLLYSTIAEQVKKLEKVSMVDKMPSNYDTAYEEQDDFRPQKRLKLDIEAASSKDKDFI